MLEPTVDRLGRTVAGAGAIEVGQYVSGALLQGPPQRYDLTQGGRDTLAYGVDQPTINVRPFVWSGSR